MKDGMLGDVVSLAASKFFVIFLGLIISSLNTSQLKPTLFGHLAFIISISSFFQLLMYPGIFQTGSRLLAENIVNKERTKELYGAMLVIGFLFSGLMLLAVFIFSYFNDLIFSNNLGSMFRQLSVLIMFYPFLNCINNILQGSGKIFKLSLFNIAPYLLYLIFISIFINESPSVQRTATVYFASFLVITLSFALSLKPSFHNLGNSLTILRRSNVGGGYRLYFGSLFITSLNYLTAYFIAFYETPENFGIYSLAFTIAFPVSILPSLFGITYFSRFVRDSRSGAMHAFTITISLACFVIFLLVLKPIFSIMYDKGFNEALKLAYLLSIHSLILGFGDYFSKFNLSKGNSKAILIVSATAFAVGILSCIVFLRLFEFKWIALAQGLSSLIYCGGMIYYGLTNRSHASS